MSKLTLSALTVAVLGFSTIALADVYVTTGAYYSKADNASDQTGPGTSLGLGYEINSVWSLEFGYDNLIDEDGTKPYLVNYPQTTTLDFEDSYSHRGWILSALGKTAIDDSSTLFYRAGVMQSKVRYKVYSQGEQICIGKPDDETGYSFVDAEGNAFQRATGCGYTQTSTDFMFGLGVQTNFSEHWFGRLEALHLFADKGEPVTAAKISIGYKF